MSEHVQGSEIRRVRERLGEHQAQFGKRFDVCRRTVIRWEKSGTEFCSWGAWNRDDRKTRADLWLEAVKAAAAHKNPHQRRRKGRKSPAGNRARRRKPVARRVRAARRRRVTGRGRRR